jgi:hypothetical protein
MGKSLQGTSFSPAITCKNLARLSGVLGRVTLDGKRLPSVLFCGRGSSTSLTLSVYFRSMAFYFDL